LRLGWWFLLFYLSLGIVLEAMHGFKVSWYMDVSNSTRRLLWTLAHSHGTLLSLVNIVFGLTLRALPGDDVRWKRWGSPCLLGANILLPGGFFLGGSFIYAGDPGLGIALLPVGAFLLLTGVFLTARALKPGGK
jgi:hypothetical protein